MGLRQHEKSNQTKNELTEAMLALFFKQGYEQTSIKNICDRAGYSVGSFYRHWESKPQAFADYWNEYIAGYICGTVENAPDTTDPEEMIDYLVERSDKFSKNEITIGFYPTSKVLSTDYASAEIIEKVTRYHQMLYEFLRMVTGNADETQLHSTANIIHVILNSHAMQYTETMPQYNIDNGTLRGSLLTLVEQLMN